MRDTRGLACVYNQSQDSSSDCKEISVGWNGQEGSDEVARFRKIREDLGLPF